MDIKDHGAWRRYKPAEPPKDAPVNALFARRDGDGTDWYDYVNSGENFAPDTIKLTVVNDAVAAATTDPTALFPGGATVLEISGVQVHDPQQAFGRKIYDAGRKGFSDPPPPFADMPNPLDDIMRRLEALEAKRGSD